jgi:hypothetical protein
VARLAALCAVLAAIAIAAPTDAAAHEGAAVRDAEARLAGMALPPGAESLSAEPSGIAAQLDGPPERPSSPNLVDRGAWWAVPSTPEAVLSWFRANPPAGSAVSGGGAGELGAGVEYRYLRIEWPPLQAVSTRTALVTVTARPEGGTALRIDAQAIWLEAHPGAELIQRSARFLEVAWHRPAGPDSIATVADGRFVQSIAVQLNRLPVVQPGVYHCPMMRADPPSVTLRFRAHRRGPLLAEAVQSMPPGGPCRAMDVAIRGRREPALEGAGPVIARLRKLRRR